MNKNKKLEDEVYKFLWAKSNPYKHLVNHLAETAAVAKVLITAGCFETINQQLQSELNINNEQVVSLVCYLAACHDLGKIHPSFVGSGAVPEAKEFLEDDESNLSYRFEHFRHEQYGQLVFLRIASNRGFSQYICFTLSSVIQFHHQKNYGIPLNGSMEPNNYEIWKSLQDRVESIFWNMFKPPVDIVDFHADVVCTLLLGIIITADWIASGEIFSSYNEEKSAEEIFKRAEELAYNFLKKNNMLHMSPISVSSFLELWDNIPEDGMRPLQKTIDKIFSDKDEKPLALIIEAPMGEGKTEAALYAATQLAQRWNKEGFYVALPTSATSNQMYKRVNELLKKQGIDEAKLMHSMAWLMDDIDDVNNTSEDHEHIRKWTAPMRKGFIAPYSVGTVDQAMMSITKVRYGVLRLIGLATKVLIIDECHAYDSYMSEMIKRLLEWCRELQIPVILLSATLPSVKKTEFMQIYNKGNEANEPIYPSVTLLYKDKIAKEVKVPSTYMKSKIKINTANVLCDNKKTAEIAEEYLNKNDGCICVIMNTVKEAQKVWEELSSKLDKDVLLFHARFSAERRDEIEKECIKLFGKDKSNRPKRAILVATQVVEQSLDLDFDYMITALCPIDLLFQRIGRVWRHENTVRPANIKYPEVTVLVPQNDNEFGPSGAIYAEIILELTEKIILEKKVLKLPDDIPTLVEKVYTAQDVSKDIDKWFEHLIDEKLESSKAKVYELDKPSKDEFCLIQNGKIFNDDENQFMSVKTRLGEPSVRLALLPYELFEQVKTKVECDEKISRKLAKQVLKYSFSVREKTVKDYLKCKCSNGYGPVCGDGLISNLWMFPAENGICQLTNAKILKMDYNEGFIIEEKE